MNSTLVFGVAKVAGGTSLAILAIVVAGAVAGGCGGDTASNGGSCGSVAPCGGDITGTWTIASICLPNSSAASVGTCAGTTLQVDSANIKGTLTFSAGTYEESVTGGSVVETVTEPMTCLNGTACASVSGTSGNVSGVCAVSGANCVCTATVTETVAATSGTYSIAGSMITVSSSNAAETDGYCVQGNTLTVFGSVATMMTLSGTAELVLTRQ